MHRPFAILVFATILAACSGGGGVTPQVTGTGSGAAAVPSVRTDAPTRLSGYRLVDLGANFYPSRLNKHTLVVGYTVSFSTPEQAAYFYKGHVTVYPQTTGETSSWATAVNDRGTVVGEVVNSYAQRASYFSQSGPPAQVVTSTAYLNTDVEAINDNGAMAGWVITNTSNPCSEAAKFSHGSVMLLGSSPYAWGIDGHGEIAAVNFTPSSGSCADGSYAPTLYDPKNVIPLPGDAAVNGGSPTGMNKKGAVVGTYNYCASGSCTAGSFGQAGFVFANGHTESIHSSSTAPCLWTTGINLEDQVVGYQQTGGASCYDAPTHAVIVIAGKVMDLNRYLGASTNWVLEVASDINDKGVIAGYGTMDGAVHGFLLVPQQCKDIN
jgi:hypothetical protein